MATHAETTMQRPNSDSGKSWSYGQAAVQRAEQRPGAFVVDGATDADVRRAVQRVEDEPSGFLGTVVEAVMAR